MFGRVNKMLYCLLYLLCPRMYHDLFVADRRHQTFDIHVHPYPPPRDEFRDIYADTPVFDDIQL